MSRKSAVRHVDARVHSLALRHVHPHKMNVRAAVDHFAKHLQSLGPVELSRLDQDSKGLEQAAAAFFGKVAPRLGVVPREDPNAKKVQQLAVAQDLAMASSVGKVGVQ